MKVCAAAPSPPVASPTPPAAPICAINALPYGGFEDGTLSGLTIQPVSGAPVTTQVVQGGLSVSNSQSGSYFLDITTNGRSSFNLVGTLPVKAGSSVSCGGYFNYPGDGNTPLGITVTVDGASCAGVNGVISTNEWDALQGGTGIVTRDNL
jgi:hypothetical protein